MANPRGSRSVSAEPFFSPPTVENRTNTSVVLPTVPRTLGLGEFADVVGYGECAVSARTLGVNDPLGDALRGLKCCSFLDQVNILQQALGLGAPR